MREIHVGTYRPMRGIYEVGLYDGLKCSEVHKSRVEYKVEYPRIFTLRQNDDLVSLLLFFKVKGVC
jgi:hypothetical protein